MTAQVAVLNTNGIALASDSAVTITGGGQSNSQDLWIGVLRDLLIAA